MKNHEQLRNNTQQLNWGTPFCFTTTLVFLVLKLTHVIDWNWWWIFSPLWIPIGFSLVVIIIWVIGLIIAKGRLK